MRLRTALVVLSVACLASCSALGGSTPKPFEIGAVHREVTTSSEDAQLWFDRGLALCFGFNHEEAVRCFDHAIAADPDCAMAFWGKAYALGPNYNAPEMEPPAIEQAREAIRAAQALTAGCSEVELALIDALASRYGSPDPEHRRRLDHAYADAMRSVHAAFPDDADVAALTAEALMQLAPWKLWSPQGEESPVTADVRDVLEPALRRWPDHPALCHLYIHAMEAGPLVAEALPAAQRLEGLVPGSGHLIHMPSHAYVWTGRYADVVRVNVKAVAVDDAFVEYAGRENFYTLYRLHNFHFVAYGSMFEGQREQALRYSRRLVQEIPESLLLAIPDFLDVFTATPYHVMVRFGMWEDILAEPEPQGDLCAARAVWRYARGVALAAQGRVEEALAEQEAFLAARAAVPDSRLLFNNPVHGILAVAEAVLAGEIEYRRGNVDAAFAHLRRAVELDEQLNYDEPWGWMEPARHPLGALLTEQGRFDEAIEVYQRNLARYPENGWALHGLAECLRATGRADEAAAVEARFAKAWARADTEIPGSCYCRTAVASRRA